MTTRSVMCGRSRLVKRERAEVVRADVQFEVIDRAKGRRHHDAGVVDQDVEVAAPLVGEGPHRLEVGEIQFADLVGAVEVARDRAALVDVANGQNRSRPVGAEFARGLESDPTGRPGDDDGLSREIGNIALRPLSSSHLPHPSSQSSVGPT